MLLADDDRGCGSGEIGKVRSTGGRTATTSFDRIDLLIESFQLSDSLSTNNYLQNICQVLPGVAASAFALQENGG